MNIIKNCKECELNPDRCAAACMSDIQSVPEKTAAAPSPSVPAVDSRSLTFDAVHSLFDDPHFCPTVSFTDFALLMKAYLSEGVDYHAILSGIAVSHQHFTDMTVSQIVSVFYAVAYKEQSK